MAFKDKLKSLGDILRQGPMREEESPDKVSSLNNGGFTGFRPKVNEESVKRGRKKAPAATEYNAPLMPGAPRQAMGYGMPQQGQTAWQSTGYGAPQQMQQTAWQPQPAAQEAWQGAAPQPAQEQQPGGNISYIHTTFADGTGEGYRHIERLAQPLSTASCYRIIEFMRNGESVIVNVDGIPDDREKQRCLDLLYGAAFTMQCSFTRVATKSIYLIAPQTVHVMLYENLRQLNEEDSARRWPGSTPEQAPVRPSGRENHHGVYTPYAVGERYSRG